MSRRRKLVRVPWSGGITNIGITVAMVSMIRCVNDYSLNITTWKIERGNKTNPLGLGMWIQNFANDMLVDHNEPEVGGLCAEYRTNAGSTRYT